MRTIHGRKLGDNHALPGWPVTLDDFARATSRDVATAVLGNGSLRERLVPGNVRLVDNVDFGDHQCSHAQIVADEPARYCTFGNDHNTDSRHTLTDRR